MRAVKKKLSKFPFLVLHIWSNVILVDIMNTATIYVEGSPNIVHETQAGMVIEVHGHEYDHFCLRNS